MDNNDLIVTRKKGKVFGTSGKRIGVTVKTSEIEQTSEMRHKAARLLCRAMIRVYLRENGKTADG